MKLHIFTEESLKELFRNYSENIIEKINKSGHCKNIESEQNELHIHLSDAIFHICNAPYPAFPEPVQLPDTQQELDKIIHLNSLRDINKQEGANLIIQLIKSKTHGTSTEKKV